MNLQNAFVYDIETFPNVFTLTAETLHGDTVCTWEISHFRDDRNALFQWFEYLTQLQIPMIGFFSLKFDYPVIHWLRSNPLATPEQIYEKSRQLAKNFDGFGNVIWDRDRFAPQIDLFMIHHFDNKAKRTDLKSLQINMRSDTVEESPVEFGTVLTPQQVEQAIIPYNKHDVSKTKQFTYISMTAINYRIGLIPKFGIEVLNYNDVKIGAKMFEQKLGDTLCYDRIPRYPGDNYGKRSKRQTPRSRIALSEIIFPYIKFSNLEFQRVLDFMRAQVLTPDDIDDPDAPIRTKGVFQGLHASVGGLRFHFGTGGVHASVTSQRFQSGGGWIIRDIDVKALYPSIAIKNGLYPEHLGPTFVDIYSGISAERDLYAKGTTENATLKLANNGPWGQSNNKFSVFYDPRYAMTIPINGQLMICMLAEWLLAIPTLQIIQANTDGITYYIHKTMEPHAAKICADWQAFTLLTLEDANYSRMFIRDVNNYIAEDTKGKLKQKGAYWHPATGDKYAESISQASPPCWYKDLGNIVAIKAANAAMLQGIDPITYIRAHTDPYDFMMRVKVDRASQLLLHGKRIQSTTRYYVSTNGGMLTKVSPPKGEIGAYKRAQKLSDAFFNQVMREIGAGVWDERIHTKNKSKYDQVTTAIEAGWRVAECNNAANFRFDNVNYDYYIAEAKKLIIG